MPIATSCPNCDQAYNLADTQHGKTVVCRTCTKPFIVGEGRASRSVRVESEKEDWGTSPSRERDDRLDYDHGRRPRDRERDHERERDRDRGRDRDRDWSDRRRSEGVSAVVWIAVAVGISAFALMGCVGVLFLFSGPRPRPSITTTPRLPPRIAPPGGNVGDPISWNNFVRINIGMTEAEVVAILGRNGRDVTVAGDPTLGHAFLNAGATKIVRWESGQRWITVWFRADGRVFHKHGHTP